jgi:YtkA-like
VKPTWPKGRMSGMGLLRFVALSAAALALASCSSTPGGTAAPDAGDDGLVSCDSDPLAMSYTSNLAVMGSGHVFQVVLVASDPAPPAHGNDTFTIRVLDASGNAVPNPTLAVSLYMPRHGHGSSTAGTTFTPNPDGTYTVTPLTLFMAGLWQVTFNVTSGSQSDTAVFGFCVAG